MVKKESLSRHDESVFYEYLIHFFLFFEFRTANCTPHKELLEHFHSVNATLVFAKMFGFRFSQSMYITIKCEVGIFSGSFAVCTVNEMLMGSFKQNPDFRNFYCKTIK